VNAAPSSGTGSRRPVLLVVGGAVTIQVLAGILLYSLLPGWSVRGAFGDMFGVVGVLFSGLALGGVVYAVLLQRSELAIQRQELELTREELAKTAEAQRSSAEMLAAQFALAKEAAEKAEQRSLLETVPILHFRGASYPRPERYEVAVENLGAMVRFIEVAPRGDFELSFSPRDVFPHGPGGQLVITSSRKTQSPFDFELAFTDALGRRRTLLYTAQPEIGVLREQTTEPRTPPS
jgi:phosphopantetheinyl transferase (holo-ACP synthase)